MKRYTQDQVLKLLRDKQDGRTQKELAEEIGCAPGYLSDVFSKRREPGAIILSYLTLKEDVEYIKQ